MEGVGIMAIPVDIEMRRLAKERNHYLFQFVVDGRQKEPPSGTISYAGPLSEECIDEFLAMVNRWQKEAKL